MTSPTEQQLRELFASQAAGAPDPGSLAALTLLGPAELDERSDPKVRLRRERERRVAAARAAHEGRS